MRSISDIINESLLNECILNEGYDKEIFQRIKDAADRTDEYCFYAVSFNDIDGNNGYLVFEQNNNIDKYLSQDTDFVQHYEKIVSDRVIYSCVRFCEKMPSSLYCCGITLKDINRTQGYLFLPIDDDSDKRIFEKWLKQHVALVDVI